MVYKVDFSLSTYRYLYEPLYSKVLTYSLANGEAEQSVTTSFIRLISRDKSLYLLIELKGVDIVSHCFVQVNPLPMNSYHAVIAQIETPSSKKSTFLQECIDYIQSDIRQDYPTLSKIILSSTLQDYRTLRKQYSLNVDRVIMSLDIKDEPIPE